MPPIRVRVRTPSATLTLEAADDWPLARLLGLIAERAGLAAGAFEVKAGYPPAPLDTSAAAAAATTVGALGLSGATLVVVPGGGAAAPPPAAAAPAPAPPAPAFTPKRVEMDETVVPWEERGAYLVLRVMPDDNSCMFTAFGGVLGLPDPAARLRAEVAAHILTHGDKYTKVVLENTEPGAYAQRLQDPQRWGGAIELQCLSEMYGIQICSIDVKYGRIDTYGLEQDTRCVLLYSGIHYDRIAQTFDLGLPVEADVTKWPTADAGVLGRARALAAKLKAARYYTDTQTMAIRCEVPGCEHWLGAGERDMVAHTRATGHASFSELAVD